MSFLALLIALSVGYYHQAQLSSQLAQMLKQAFLPYLFWLERYLNDGQNRHLAIAWALAVGLPSALVATVYFIADAFNGLLGLAVSILILSFTLQIGRFGRQSELISTALNDHNVDLARAKLTEWTGLPADAYTPSIISRLTIEGTLRDAHYDLFAPIFWFVLLGPVGALVYRLSWLAQQAFAQAPMTVAPNVLGQFSKRIFDWLDWLPVRFTAGAFAVVGDFEDALYCWRTQAESWPDKAAGIFLASGAGALGVKLGEPIPVRGVLEFRPELGLGDEADADYIRSATGLIWRVLVMILGLMLLLTFAHWLGN
jgi:adenosylcobinamide-phosphate synthase